MASLFETHIQNTLEDYFNSGEFKALMKLAVKWGLQGFERGYGFEERKALTAAVARRIRQRARRPIYLLGKRIWRARLPRAECATEAERIVTGFLVSERIKFGDPRYCWDSGADLADADMEYWDACP